MPRVKSTKEKAGKRKYLNQQEQVVNPAVLEKKRKKDTDPACDEQETVFTDRNGFSSEILKSNIREVEIRNSKTKVSRNIHESQTSSLNSSFRRVTRSRARALKQTNPDVVKVRNGGTDGSYETVTRKAKPEGKDISPQTVKTKVTRPKKVKRDTSSKKLKGRERNPSEQENIESVCGTVKKEDDNSSDPASLRQKTKGKGLRTKNIENVRSNSKLSNKNSKERNPSDQENTKSFCGTVKKEDDNSSDPASLRQKTKGKGLRTKNIENVRSNGKLSSKNSKERNPSDQENTKSVCGTGTVKKEDEIRSDQRSLNSKQSQVEKTSQSGKSAVMKKFVGAHLSIIGGLENVIKEAREIGAEAVGLFLKSQRSWKCKPLEEKAVEKFKKACQDLKFPANMILPHGSYLLNCGSHKAELLAKSRESLIDDLHRCDRLGIQLFNFHPGSTCGEITVDECVSRIAESINIAHSQTQQVTVLIENMSCQGHTVGGKFEELRDIIAQVKDKDRVGVCLDTCHAFAAGFNIKTKAGYEQMMTQFENIIGLEYLKAVHLNDSKEDVGCHMDRHENIGKGKIGLAGFRHVMKDKRLNNIPMILETPPVIDDRDEIKLLYSL